MKSNNIVQILSEKNVFINNKYFKAYCKIIQNALNENRKRLKKDDPQYVYYECHHILPKKLGGSNDFNNLVLLTKQEHFIVHHLLTKCTIDYAFYQMSHAYWKMCTDKKYGIIKNGKQYAYAKELGNLATSTWWQNLSETEKSNITNKISIGVKRGHANKSIETRELESKRKREAFHNRSEENKKNAIKKYQTTMSNRNEEEKAEIQRKWKETRNSKSEEYVKDIYLRASESKKRFYESEEGEKLKEIFSQQRSGEKNGMHGKCAYDIWVEKYGIEEANKRRDEAIKKGIETRRNKKEIK